MNTPTNIRNLKENQIFVFGSNTEGRHGKGAAKFAMQKFGARWGQASGLQGRSYGLPTVGKGLSKMPLIQIEHHVNQFIKCAEKHPELEFLVTLVGCGLAGHKPSKVGPFFKNAPSNCVLPVEFELAIILHESSN